MENFSAGYIGYGFGVLILLLLAGFMTYILPVIAVNSTTGNFTVTPDMVYFNWTNTSISITANNDSMQLYVDTQTTGISPQYFTSGKYQINDYVNLTGPNRNTCFGNQYPGTEFIIQNETGYYTNTTIVLNNTNSTLFYLTPYMFCPPGNYSGNFTVYNISSATENASIAAVITIPISPENTFIESNNTAFFKGTMSGGGYHSYYFWTNQSDNITGVTIGLSGFSGDIDIFLFDNQSQLQGKSINTGSSGEEIAYASLPNPWQMWEMRVYGNVSSDYRGDLYFTTINITNTYQNETISSLDFGTLDPNQTGSSLEFALKNEDSQVVNNVNQSAEVYHVGTWLNTNSSSSFFFLVPNFTQKVKVKVEWGEEAGKNITDWDLFLKDPNGNVIGNSTSKYLNANITNVTREEFVVFEGAFNTTNEGYWNITVLNQTNGTLSYYNVTAYIWFSESLWINTTYNQSTDFNSSGSGNSSYNITANITVPSRYVLNGSYEGFLQYYNGSGWKLRLPLSFNVKAGTLIINNSLNTVTSRIAENIGFNRAGSTARTMNITFNNTGGYDIYYTGNTSNYTLYLVGSSSKYMNFTVDSWPDNPILNGSSGTIDITIPINTSLTNNTAGIYMGWIFFNTTNTTVNSSSYPHETFNLTLEVNLTDKLTVSITNINPAWVANTSIKTNITLTTEVRLANGTIISKATLMDITNFTSSWMNETNVTSYGKNLTNITPKSGVACGSTECSINVTVPTSVVGGRYKVSLDTIWFTGESNLTGIGTNSSLIVNDFGLKLTAITSTALGPRNELTNVYFNITVRNFGPKTAAGTLSMSTWTYASITAYDTVIGGSCGSKSNNYFNININGNGSETCWYQWEIRGTNETTNHSTSLNVSASDTNFGNIYPITITILNVVSGGDGNGGGTDSTCSADSECATGYYCSTSGTCTALSCGTGERAVGHACVPYTFELSITSYEPVIYVNMSGSNHTLVTVKNTGGKNSTAKLNVSINNGINTSTTPEYCVLIVNESCTFNVTFNVSDTAEIGNYSGTLKAYITINTSAYTTKSFTLTVLPTEEKEVEINATYESYRLIIADLLSQFTEIKASGFVAEANLSKAELLLNQSNNTLEQIRAAIDSGDYITANSLLSDLNTTISRIKDEIAVLISSQTSSTRGYWETVWLWGIIGVIAVVVVGILVYMFLPPAEGYHPQYGYTPPREKGIISRIKKFFSRIKGKPKTGEKKVEGAEKGHKPQPQTEAAKKPQYIEGYEKHPPSEYSYSGRKIRIPKKKK